MLPGWERVPHPKDMRIRFSKGADENAPCQKIIPASLTGFSKGCRGTRHPFAILANMKETNDVKPTPYAKRHQAAKP